MKLIIFWHVNFYSQIKREFFLRVLEDFFNKFSSLASQVLLKKSAEK